MKDEIVFHINLGISGKVIFYDEIRHELVINTKFGVIRDSQENFGTNSDKIEGKLNVLFFVSIFIETIPSPL